MKLKSLLVQKFLNKYSAHNSASKEDGLDVFIENELETMFRASKFDERDLVKIDKKVRNYIKQSKLTSISKQINQDEKPYHTKNSKSITLDPLDHASNRNLRKNIF
jgi:hypothetical protein